MRSTFVVRFIEDSPGTCRGRVRHVASGEEAGFADEQSLLALLHRMKFLGSLIGDGNETTEPAPEAAAGSGGARSGGAGNAGAGGAGVGGYEAGHSDRDGFVAPAEADRGGATSKNGGKS